MSEHNKQLVRRALDEIYAQGDLERADELIHPDFVDHAPEPYLREGRALPADGPNGTQSGPDSRPSCLSIPRSSRLPQCSTILSSAIRQM